RQMLRDRNPRYAGGDRLKLSADLRRSVRFQVKGIEVRRPAVVEDEDAGLGAATGRRCLSRGAIARRCPQAVCPQQPAKAKCADSQKLTPWKAVAQTNAPSEEGKHGDIL